MTFIETSSGNDPKIDDVWHQFWVDINEISYNIGLHLYSVTLWQDFSTLYIIFLFKDTLQPSWGSRLRLDLKYIVLNNIFDTRKLEC